MENVAILALAYQPFPILSKVDLNIQIFLLLKLFRADLNNFSKLDGNQNTMFFSTLQRPFTWILYGALWCCVNLLEIQVKFYLKIPLSNIRLGSYCAVDMTRDFC